MTDYKDILSNWRLAMKELEQIRKSINPSFFVYESLFKPYHQYHLNSIQNFLAYSDSYSKSIQGIVSENQHLYEMFKKVAEQSKKEMINLQLIHSSWFETFKKFQNQVLKYDLNNINKISRYLKDNISSSIQSFAKLSSINTNIKLTISENLLTKINFQEIMKTFQIESSEISLLKSSCISMNTNYKDFLSTLNSIQDYFNLPSSVISSGSNDIFSNSYSLNKILHEDDSDEEESIVKNIEYEISDVSSLLEKINPDLLKPYNGAYEAFYSNNTDRIRHVLSSLRELWNHLLRYLAPDDNVLNWIPDKIEQYIGCDGHPTRKARILYICRNINNDKLSSFLIADTKALIELLNFFNRIHELYSSLTNNQLEALLFRSKSWLFYILNICEEN